MKQCRIGTNSVYTIQPCNTLGWHFIQSDGEVMAVTRHSLFEASHHVVLVQAADVVQQQTGSVVALQLTLQPADHSLVVLPLVGLRPQQQTVTTCIHSNKQSPLASTATVTTFIHSNKQSPLTITHSHQACIHSNSHHSQSHTTITPVFTATNCHRLHPQQQTITAHNHTQP